MDIREIASLVEQETGISWNDMRLDTRKREIVFARQLVMAMAKKYTKKPLREIGEPFDRHYATVLYAEKTISNLCETDIEVYKRYRRIDINCWRESEVDPVEIMCNNCVQL